MPLGLWVRCGIRGRCRLLHPLRWSLRGVLPSRRNQKDAEEDNERNHRHAGPDSHSISLTGGDAGWATLWRRCRLGRTFTNWHEHSLRYRCARSVSERRLAEAVPAAEIRFHCCGPMPTLALSSPRLYNRPKRSRRRRGVLKWLCAGVRTPACGLFERNCEGERALRLQHASTGEEISQ
jgi:hypothetical protein